MLAHRALILACLVLACLLPACTLPASLLPTTGSPSYFTARGASPPRAADAPAATEAPTEVPPAARTASSPSLAADAPAAGTTAPTPSPAQALKSVRVRVVDASIAPKRAGGATWLAAAPAQPWTPIEPGTRAAVPAPAPRVEVRFAGRDHVTAALPPTLAPAWNQDLLLELASASADDPVIIIVRDGLDGREVGSQQVTVAELLWRDELALTQIPSVRVLHLRLERVVAKRSTERLVIGGNATATIAVAGGDLVALEARGRVCLSPNRCTGADGDASLPSDPAPANASSVPTAGLSGRAPATRAYRGADPAFTDQPPGAIVGWFREPSGRTIRVVVGSGRRFRAPRVGTLHLQVNDRTPADNTGRFDVDVRFNP